MQTTTRRLMVKLQDDQVALRSQELAELELSRARHDAEIDVATEEWKAQKKELDLEAARLGAEAGRLARVVKDREEEQDVECRIDVLHGQATLTRTDTGEVVEQRLATDAELQMDIPA